MKAEIRRMGFKTLTALLYFSLTRIILQKTVLPNPGQGPSKETREKGFFRLKLIGMLNGEKIGIQVSCNNDPGYSGTAQMISEAAICLAKDEEKLPLKYGILTPASAMGSILMERLQKTGMDFSSLTDF